VCPKTHIIPAGTIDLRGFGTHFKSTVIIPVKVDKYRKNKKP